MTHGTHHQTSVVMSPLSDTGSKPEIQARTLRELSSELSRDEARNLVALELFASHTEPDPLDDRMELPKNRGVTFGLSFGRIPTTIYHK